MEVGKERSQNTFNGILWSLAFINNKELGGLRVLNWLKLLTLKKLKLMVR